MIRTFWHRIRGHRIKSFDLPSGEHRICVDCEEAL